MASRDRKFEELILSRVGWQAQTGEELYETTFVEEPRPLSPEEEAWAHEVIEDYLEQKRTA